MKKYLPIENPESFLDVEMIKPEPAGHDILVAVKAIAVNPVDTKVRAPKDKVEEEPRVIGWDTSGEIESVGLDVKPQTWSNNISYLPMLPKKLMWEI